MFSSWFPWGAAKLGDLLSGEEFEKVFGKIYELSHRVPFQIKTTEAMHYRRYLLQHNLEERKIGHGHGHPGGAAQKYEPGAPTADAQTAPPTGPRAASNDGKGFLLCLPRGQRLSQWLSSHPTRATSARPAQRNLPQRAHLQIAARHQQAEGQVRCLRVQEICGGSRARAYALTGDPLAPEPCCIYHPRHWDTELENEAAAFAGEI